MQNQQGPLKFTGLTLSSNGGELPPGASPVFHNCDISADGDVVRRAGSNLVGSIPQFSVGPAWTQVVKTRKGTEYLVVVTTGGISVRIMTDVNATATIAASINKVNVFSRPLTDVNFVLLPAPYDRLLILTGNHPPIQLSFLERTSSFTCTNAVAGTITSPYTSADSKLWRDTSASSTLVQDTTISSSIYSPVTSKSAGFTLNAPALGLVLNEVRELTLVSVTWQWWAEALNWSGSDFSQNTVRYSATAIDQNVKIPTALLTDLDPRYLTSAYRGIIMTLGNDGATTGFILPVASPTTTTEWAHGSGQRYIYTATNAPLHTPFFATFQGIEAVGTQTPISFHRVRELRFNGGTGCSGTYLDFYVDGVKKTQRFSISATFSDGDYLGYKDTYTTQRNITGASVVADVITGLAPLASGRPLSSQVDVIISNTEPKWVGSTARSVLYTDLPVGGGTLDGCYVPAIGLGSYADYLRGRFPPFGCLFRDRLVFRTYDEASDQLLLSATGDELSPGNFYSFFQITDALDGVTDDPFTVNVTTKSREKLTALLAWQQSLFIFTAVSTYSLTAGEVFGPEAYTTGLVASYGAFNPRCVVATNLTVLFLNRYGLFDLLNKNNTSDYGSFERSEPVRPIFADYPVTSKQDKLPWLSLNDTTNKAYIGLPVKDENLACKVVLSLNLAWNSWSTLSSAAVFNVTAAVQLFNYMIFMNFPRDSSDVLILQMDALHHLDLCVYVPITNSTVTNYQYPRLKYLILNNADGVLNLNHPTPPLLREYAIDSKQGVSYVTSPPNPISPLSRNWMFDIPELAPFLGTSVSFDSVVTVSDAEPFPLYPLVSSRTDSTITLNGAVSVTGTVNPSTTIMGTIYPSVFATTPFNTDSLGRLKRLKKLHLLFDNTSVLTKKYFEYNSTLKNSAIAIIRYNYGDGEYVADAQLIGDYSRLDYMALDSQPSTKEREQISIPLQGYGADYQLYICSTGGDAFKLTAYEFDVQQQRTKTYVKD